MAERTHALTAEGREKMEKELEYLRTVRRQEVAERLKSAIDEGDLSENAGYDESKREQAFVEGRIRELEAILANAATLEAAGPSDVVVPGSAVTVVEDAGDGAEDAETYHIVSAVEADPLNGRISYESPLGRALLGRKRGDRVEVLTPGGVIHFRVLEIG